MAKKGPKKDRTIIIEGYVESVDLENGDAGVLIYDGNEDFYVVMNEKGKELLDYIDEEVEATGVLSKNRGYLVLKVLEYRVRDLYETWDEDRDEDFDGSWFEESAIEPLPEKLHAR